MTTDQTDAIRMIQSGLDKLGHAPGAMDGQWGVRTARALKQLITANGRAASLPPQGPLPWITEAKTALERVRQKWTPVLSPDTRKNKRLESVWRFCHRQTDSRPQ